jgi:outer membrane protein assembly factor BamB
MTRLAAIAALLFAVPALAQFDAPPQLSPDVTVDEIDQVTLSQLQRADKFLAEKQYSDGLETLRRAIDQESQRLAPTKVKSSPAGFTTYLSLRDFGQLRLCALPPEALRLYRSQIDAEAKTLLDQAKQNHDETLLERIVQQYLASSSGDEAALLLGDAALARGDVVAARAAWLKLHPSLRTSDAAAQALGVYPGLPWFSALRGRLLKSSAEGVRDLLTSSAEQGLTPAHPDTNVAVADARARLIAASILEENAARAEWELGVFRALHDGQQGRLAGRNGLYTELLQQMLEQSRTWPQAPPRDDCPTFAGNYERNQVFTGNVDITATPLWTAELPRVKSDRDLIGAGRLRVAEHHDGVLSYHPIVFRGEVIVGDGGLLRALELATGKPAWDVQLRERPEVDLLTNQQVGVPRFTLSAADGMVAATLPTSTVPGRRATAIRREELSRIVAVDLVTRKLVFEAVADDATMIFEGTPIIDRGRAYVVVRKQAEIMPQLFVACFDIASGRRLWLQQICTAQSLGEGKRVEYANSLLTLSHDTLYCNSNLGAIAALSTSDGALRWLTRYPRAAFPAQKPERTDRHFFRDLNPCLVHQGQVICAPQDCERIFSLDATSGQLVWTLPPNDAADAVHLLGVGNGYLLASGDYLYWINVVTGQVVTQFPAALPIGPGLALPAPRGWGRGVLAGDRVYWPTQSALHVFAQSPQRTGMFTVPKQIKDVDWTAGDAAGGNLVLAGGRLIVATADRLIAFAAQKASRE